MRKIKRFIIFTFFNHYAVEAIFIDSWFEAFGDGMPRDKLPPLTGPLVWTQIRVVELLIEMGYLKVFGNGYVITSNGLIFLAKGGFTSEIIREKTDRWALAVSFLATIISIAAFFFAF